MPLPSRGVCARLTSAAGQSATTIGLPHRPLESAHLATMKPTRVRIRAPFDDEIISLKHKTIQHQ
jgi:hypothetical protein